MSSKVLILLLFFACPAYAQTPTPGPNDCCQCVGVCALPSTGALCTVGCTAVYNANCTGLLTSCTTFTPTQTPTQTPTRTPTNTFRATPVVCGDANGDGCTSTAECNDCGNSFAHNLSTPAVCDCNGNYIITNGEVVVCLNNSCPTSTPTQTATYTFTLTPTLTPSPRYQMLT